MSKYHLRTLLDPGVTAETIARLRRLQPDHPRRWGTMNAHQAVCHLCDSFRFALGEREVSAATGFFQRTILKTAGLRIPLPWPKGVPTRPEVDPQQGGTPPAEFDRDLNHLVALITRFCHRPRNFSLRLHPVFGPLNEWEWMRWGYLHTDHHLRQFGQRR